MRPERYKSTYTLTSHVMDWLNARSDKRYRTRSKQLETDLLAFRALLDDGFKELTLIITPHEFEVISKVLRPILTRHEDIVLLAKTDLRGEISDGLRFLAEAEKSDVDCDALREKLGNFSILQRVALCDRINERLWACGGKQGELTW